MAQFFIRRPVLFLMSGGFPQRQKKLLHLTGALQIEQTTFLDAPTLCAVLGSCHYLGYYLVICLYPGIFCSRLSLGDWQVVSQQGIEPPPSLGAKSPAQLIGILAAHQCQIKM